MYTSGVSQTVSAWPNENEQGSKGNSSLIDILVKWEQFFDHQVDSSEFINQLAGGDIVPLAEIKKRQRQLRQWLLIDLIRLSLDSQRQTVRAVERLLITQLNDLFDGFNRLLETQPIAAKQLRQTIKLVQETSLGMGRLYASHFNVDQQLPLCLQAGYKTSLRQHRKTIFPTAVWKPNTMLPIGRPLLTYETCYLSG